MGDSNREEDGVFIEATSEDGRAFVPPTRRKNFSPKYGIGDVVYLKNYSGKTPGSEVEVVKLEEKEGSWKYQIKYIISGKLVKEGLMYPERDLSRSPGEG